MFGMKRSDAHLVSQVLRGHKEHYTPLVERYLPAVRAVARANAGAWADVEDIAQESFVDAYRTLDRLRERNKFSHWLLRIARNKARNWAEADRRERMKREAAGALRVETPPTPEEREIHALLHAELEAMPPEQREVIALFHLAGHGTREIAGMLGISHEAVRKRLQRGREVLGERMLRRLEEPQSKEAREVRAKAISGIAIGAVAAWEANATTGIWAAATGWGMGMKAGVVGVAVCVVAVGAYWLRDDPAGVDRLADASKQPSTGPTDRQSASTDTEGDEGDALADGSAVENVSPPFPAGDGVVFGTVYGLDDAPLPDIDVHLTLRADGASPELQQQSDASGNFRFEGVPVGSAFFTLWAVTPDERSAATAWEILMEGHPISQQFLEMRPALPITGKVLDGAGEPIRGARVRPSRYRENAGANPRPESLMPPVLTDAAGAFCFTYLKAGEWYFDVRASGYAAGTLGPVRAGDAAGSAMLLPGNVLTGVVTDDTTGEPVADIQVLLHVEIKAPEIYRSVRSDDRGHFRFEDLPEDAYRVGLYGDWFAEPVDATITQGGEIPEVLIMAERGGIVRGRVTNTDGAGVAGIEVVSPVEGRADATVNTDGDGYYALAGLPSGEINVRTSVSSAEGRIALSLAKREVKESVDFTLEAGERRVSGLAVDASGTPMAGVRIEAFGQRTNVVPQWCETDAEGRFQIGGLVGSDDFFWIRGHKDGWISRDLRLGLDKGDLENLRVVLERPAGLIGKLVDAAGRPVPGRLLALEGVDVQPYSARSARTTERGRFAFPHKSSGTYRLMDTPENGPRSPIGEVTLAAGETLPDLQITYASGGAGIPISGRIVDEKGEPVAWASVRLWRGGTQNIGSTFVRADGVFQFSVAEFGLYSVEVVKPGYSRAMREDVRAGAESIEILLLPAARVLGRVVAANGAPIKGYKVTWHRGTHEDLSEFGVLEAQTVVDPDGHFVLANVDAGTVSIAAWADGYAPAFDTLDLASGEEYGDVELRLQAVADSSATPNRPEKSTSLHGLVINERKESVAGAWIYLDHAARPTNRSGDARATSGPDGRFVIDSVPLHTRRVLAWHKDYAPAGATLSLTTKAVHETTVTMGTGGALEGTLTGGGKALRDVYLSIDSVVLEEGFYENVYPDTKGFYRVEHLAAGDTTINVHYKERWYRFPAPVAEGGVTRVDIDLLTGTSTLDGTLLHEGAPVEGQIAVRLPLPGGGEERFTYNTTRSGRFFIDELPAGAIEIEGLTAAGAKVEAQTVELAEGETREIVLQGD